MNLGSDPLFARARLAADQDRRTIGTGARNLLAEARDNGRLSGQRFEESFIVLVATQERLVDDGEHVPKAYERLRSERQRRRRLNAVDRRPVTTPQILKLEPQRA
jgi:hypothetical protein